MVWPKFSVSDYPEMLRKLSFLAFCVAIACTWLVRGYIPPVDRWLGHLDAATPTLEAIASIKIPFGTFVVGVCAAFISESVRLHDKISSALGIRSTFDTHWILIPMALLSGAAVDRAKLGRIASDRNRLMDDVFYKYASSGKKADIDKHLITQALTAWSWYWLCVESMVLLVLTASVAALFSKWALIAGLLAAVILLILLMRVFRADASDYAGAEVNAILDEPARRADIKAVFDAL
jgi:hypothetical protein